MLVLEAISFMGAATTMRHNILVIECIENRSGVVGDEDKTKLLSPQFEQLVTELRKVGARSALASATRLQQRLVLGTITCDDVRSALLDIESRFADHLVDIKLLVLNEQETSFFAPADELLGFAGRPVEGFSRAYPNSAFEIEEACKCLALGRQTACVFHCMRALEHGIKALCKLLSIPDATKPADKNWGKILDAVRAKTEEKWPKNTRAPDSKGAQIEALYVTLDAIKNPWRNATMHVETIYAPHEALHIARCTGMFLLELMKHCDEEGIPPETSPAKSSVGDEPTATSPVSGLTP
jgi:hypothetical protein